jgi:hypothetical protein
MDPTGLIAIYQMWLMWRALKDIVSALIERGVLVSKGPRDPLHLAFPAILASRWMPGPEQVSNDE